VSAREAEEIDLGGEKIEHRVIRKVLNKREGKKWNGGAECRD
jgi:hypothetical protein